MPDFWTHILGGELILSELNNNKYQRIIKENQKYITKENKKAEQKSYYPNKTTTKASSASSHFSHFHKTF